MKDVLKILEDFSPIFRDYIPGIAAAIAAVLAILTYQRAKETFLQPVRTEVIKKQTDLLIHVLERVDGDLKIMESYDVHKLVEVNLLAAMLECGAVFNEMEKVQSFVKDNTFQSAVSKEAMERDFEVIQAFSTEKRTSKQNSSKRSKRSYELAKKGKFKVEVFHITKKHVDFLQELHELISNPFMPSSVQLLLKELAKEIEKNTHTYLSEAISEAVNDSFMHHNGEMPSVSGVYNSFNHERLGHGSVATSLRDETRRYLKIDSMP